MGLKYLVWMCTRAEEYEYAFSLGGGKPLSEELTSEEAKKLFNAAADFGVENLFITGGEPLLRKDLLELIEYASAFGLKLYVKTKGWRINEEVARKLASSNCKVIVSVAGLEKVDDTLRGEGAFKRSINAASLCSKQGILYSLSVMNTKYVVNQVRDLVGLALKLGSEGFSLECLIPRPVHIEEQRVKLVPLEPTPEEREKELNELYLLSKQLGGRIRITPYDMQYNRVLKTKEPWLTLRGRCEIRNNLEADEWLEVLDDGKVYCCSPLGLAFGDVRRNPLDDVMERVRSSDLVRKLADRINIKGKCRICEFNGICGGCRARAYVYTGDMFASDPACPYRPATFTV
ncbi:MAG: radical SAM protein [Candidatus Nezhaarchaeales archaeon]